MAKLLPFDAEKEGSAFCLLLPPRLLLSVDMTDCELEWLRFRTSPFCGRMRALEDIPRKYEPTGFRTYLDLLQFLLECRVFVH